MFGCSPDTGSGLCGACNWSAWLLLLRRRRRSARRRSGQTCDNSHALASRASTVTCQLGGLSRRRRRQFAALQNGLRNESRKGDLIRRKEELRNLFAGKLAGFFHMLVSVTVVGRVNGAL